MDYEQKYKEALERCRKAFNFSNLAYSHEEIRQRLENIFPELKESKDENIRKFIIHELACIRAGEYTQDGDEQSDRFKELTNAIAWLEKQCEIVKQLEDKLDRCACKYFDKGYKAAFEKQGEQKPADKAESKFKVGDWITNGEYTWKITDIKPLDYILQSQNGDTVDTISYVDEYFHLWTIQDAKDGDVLVTNSGRPFTFKGLLDMYHPKFPVAYCGIDPYNYFDDDSDNDNEWWTGENVYPATKEQCDLLFQKMKEAGYEWNAEKKELRKIEQKPTVKIEHPSWNEEDEERIEFLIAMCNDEQTECVNNSTMYRECTETKNWLKSLKERMKGE